MKKALFSFAMFIFCAGIRAEYTQTLPLDYTDFFRAEAISESGVVLERGEYTNTTQTSGVIMANQWNRSGKTSDQVESSPELQDNSLSYGTYIDNEAGKEILLANLPLDAAEKTQTRATIYSLQEGSMYSDKTYYLSALVKITAAGGKGDILAFDGNYTANAQRARFYVNKQGSGYKLGLGWNSDPDTWTGELEFGSTHLVVIKVAPIKAGNTAGNVETATIYIDPDLSKSEDENTALATVDGTSEIVAEGSTKGLKSVRGITVRQRSKIAGSIAGLRFGERWEDVIQTTEISSIARIETDFGNTDVWGEVTATTDEAVANTSTINGFNFVKSGLTQMSATNFNGKSLTNRIVIGNQNTGAMVTLPAVSTIERVTIYARAGSNDKDLILQCFDYATNTWNLIDTYHFADQNIHVISAELNRNEPTRLRLVNADNSKKFIYRIETFPIVELERVVTNFNDDTWGEAASKYTSGDFPSSVVNGFELNAAGLLKGSIDYLPTYERLSTRISMDKGSNGGMITLPAVTGIAQIDVYANSGTADRYIKLQKYNYSNDVWEDIESWYCETTDCYRFSKTLDSDVTTRLRIANADGSTKYIYKVVTYLSAPSRLTAPEALEATNVVAHSFTAKWNPVANSSGYRIVVFNNDGTRKTANEVTGGDAFQCNVSGLDAETNYTYKVAAIGDNESFVDSYLSEAVEVTTVSALRIVIPERLPMATTVQSVCRKQVRI